MQLETPKKNGQIFHCEICDYNTCKKSLLNQHLKTNKHINKILKPMETKNIHLHIIVIIVIKVIKIVRGYGSIKNFVN